MNKAIITLLIGTSIGIVACKADQLAVGDNQLSNAGGSSGSSGGSSGVTVPVVGTGGASTGGTGGDRTTEPDGATVEPPFCGDGIIQSEGGEECDLGPDNGNGSCDMACHLVISVGGTGGVVDTGATMGTGGVGGAGGAVETGGTGAAQGSMTIPGRGGAPGRVAFNNGKAEGAMTGLGWVSLGAADILADPTCGGAPITQSAPCAKVPSWNSTSALCISGTIPIVTPTPLSGGLPDYNNNWGIMIGVNAKDSPAGAGTLGGVLGHFYETITFNISGLVRPAGAAIRGMIHVLGDPETTFYCANMVSGGPTALIAFNTKCWGEASTVLLTENDVPYIDKIGFQISSDTDTSYTLNNLCLRGITLE